MKEKKLLNVEELSGYLSLPKPTIYTWVCLGKIPPGCVVRLGRALRFEVQEIDRWVSGKTAVPASAQGRTQSDCLTSGAADPFLGLEPDGARQAGAR